jgi:hypothetical protein
LLNPSITRLHPPPGIIIERYGPSIARHVHHILNGEA